MKIGIYFNATHLDEWSWQDFRARRLALSGTDALPLFLATRLRDSSLENITFTANPGQGCAPGLQRRVDALSTAVRLAKREGLSLLLLNNTGNEDIIRGIEVGCLLQQDLVVIDHNGPSPKFADLFAVCASVRRVICVSRSQTDGIRDHPVFSKVEVIGNPLLASTEPLPLQRKPRNVVFLGSLTPSKGFHHLAAAWPKVRSVCQEATLRVIGSAKLYNRSQSLGPLGIAESTYEAKICRYLGNSRAAAAAKGVHFLGLLNPTEVQNELSQAAVCVVNPNCRTSVETFCVSAIEASAAGAAVVGGNYGGLRETISDGQTGVLIKSPHELGPALIRLLDNQALARQMGDNGRAYVAQKYGPDEILMEWRSLLQRVVDRAPPVPPRFHFDGSVRLLAREAVRLMRRLPGFRWLPALSRLRRWW